MTSLRSVRLHHLCRLTLVCFLAGCGSQTAPVGDDRPPRPEGDSAGASDTARRLLGSTDPEERLAGCEHARALIRPNYVDDVATVRAVGERMIPALAQALRDGDPELRSCAARAVASFGQPARRTLRDALARETEPNVRAWISGALTTARIAEQHLTHPCRRFSSAEAMTWPVREVCPARAPPSFVFGLPDATGVWQGADGACFRARRCSEALK